MANPLPAQARPPWLASVLALALTLGLALVAAALMVWPMAAWSAPAAPQAPLTLVTPFVAGSGPDLVARTIARHWAQMAGEPVQVINMPENQGRTAARWVATSATDGRLMMLTCSRMLDAAPLVPNGQRLRPVRTPPIALKHFQLIARVGELPFMTVLPRGLLPGAMRMDSQPHLGSVSGPAQEQVLAAEARLDDLSAIPVDPVQPDQALGPDVEGNSDEWSAYAYAEKHRLAPAPTPVMQPLRSSVFPSLLSRPDTFPRTDWNGLLVSSRMDKSQRQALQGQFETILALPEVRWAVAQAGSDLWEEVPPETTVQALPLPQR